MENYLDWSISLFSFVYIELSPEKKDLVYTKILGIISLAFIFYRIFQQLTVFSFFTYKVTMILRVMKKLLAYFSIIIFFFIITATMFLFIDSNEPIQEFLINIYFGILFGRFDKEFLNKVWFLLPAVVSNVIVTLILMKIMIAYINKQFFKLERSQKIITQKKKSLINLEFELMFILMKQIFRIKSNLEINHKDPNINKFETIKEVYETDFNTKTSLVLMV